MRCCCRRPRDDPPDRPLRSPGVPPWPPRCGPAGCAAGRYLWLDRYEPEPKALLAAGLVWAASSRPPRHHPGRGRVRPALGERQPDRRGTGGRGGREGVLPPRRGGAATASTASSTASSTPDARHRLRLRREHPLPRGRLQRHRCHRPRRCRGADRHLHPRCLVSPFAHPLFTSFIGIGVGMASGASQPGRRSPGSAHRSSGYVLAVATHALWNASTLGGIDNLSSGSTPPTPPALVCILVFAASPAASGGDDRTDDASRRGLLPASDIRGRSTWVPGPVAVPTRGSVAEQVLGHQGLTHGRPSSFGILHYRYLRRPRPTMTPPAGRRTSPRSGPFAPRLLPRDRWCPPVLGLHPRRPLTTTRTPTALPAPCSPEGPTAPGGGRTQTARGRRHASSDVLRTLRPRGR